jgi:hypothetical protein
MWGSEGNICHWYGSANWICIKVDFDCLLIDFELLIVLWITLVSCIFFLSSSLPIELSL